MTLAEKVVEILSKEEYYDVIREQFFQSEYNAKYYEDETRDIKNEFTENGIYVEHVDNYGGEDEGEQYWSVYSFTCEGQTIYVKFDGSYASYEGSTYEEFYIANAVPKTGFDFVKA